MSYYSTANVGDGRVREAAGPCTVLRRTGGSAFPVDDWTRLERFLILGCESGSYIASRRAPTVENAKAARRAIETDGCRVVKTIVEIVASGRAPQCDPSLLVLAMAASLGDDRVRSLAFTVLPRVVRTGTQLLRFAAFVDGMRGWGRGLRRAVGDWYLEKPVDELAFQVARYASQERWSHRDMLRLAHPKAGDSRDALFRWMVAGDFGDKRPAGIESGDLRLIYAIEEIGQAGSAARAAELVASFGLTCEMVPARFLDSVEVWSALLERMALGDLVRNLAKLTRVGLLRPNSEAARLVVSRLGNRWAIGKARLHPVTVLSAFLTYKSGRSVDQPCNWTPVPAVVDALEGAFYLAFGNVPKTGRRCYVGLDVSGSMGWSEIAGTPGVTPRIGAATMAMVTARAEADYHIAAFANRMAALDVATGDSLETVCRKTDQAPSGDTDCARPMLDAAERGIETDIFIVLTDSETSCGETHPVDALRRYRDRTGIAAKLVVVGMLSRRFGIADPNDAGTLDVVGFDTATPNLIADFAIN